MKLDELIKEIQYLKAKEKQLIYMKILLIQSYQNMKI